VVAATRRDPQSVTYTVRCQLSRLPGEKGLKIVRRRKQGELTRYKAA
jgi:hypothetical protein